jgi:hypothetical protein
MGLREWAKSRVLSQINPPVEPSKPRRSTPGRCFRTSGSEHPSTRGGRRCRRCDGGGSLEVLALLTAIPRCAAVCNVSTHGSESDPPLTVARPKQKQRRQRLQLECATTSGSTLTPPEQGNSQHEVISDISSFTCQFPHCSDNSLSNLHKQTKHQP